MISAAESRGLPNWKRVEPGDRCFVWHDDGLSGSLEAFEVVSLGEKFATVRWKLSGRVSRIDRRKISGFISEDEWENW